jgi:hypothetical protein
MFCFCSAMGPAERETKEKILRLGRRDLRYVAAGGVCVLLKRGSRGALRVLTVVASADIANAAALREGGFGPGLGGRPDEAVVVLEACPRRRARLLAALERAFPAPAAPNALQS